LTQAVTEAHILSAAIWQVLRSRITAVFAVVKRPDENIQTSATLEAVPILADLG
jgi:hypothetical protein